MRGTALYRYGLQELLVSRLRTAEVGMCVCVRMYIYIYMSVSVLGRGLAFGLSFRTSAGCNHKV